jgi:RNA polymerase sigma-70 factor (ECF subfamily)
MPPASTDTPTPLDDAALMLRVRNGDHAAFSVVMRTYEKKVLNFFIRLGVQYDAEDLTQQTFLRLYRYRDRYEATAKVSTFLFLLARQVWIDELRKRTRRKKLAESVAKATAGDVARSAADEVAASGTVDLQAALHTLPEEMRLVIELGVYQDLPYAEIAQILEIPEGTVKSRMFNALAQLRRLLAHPGHENKREE